MPLTHHDDMMAAVDMNERGDILIEDMREVKTLVWSSARGLKPLRGPGRMATVPAVVNDEGQAVAGFTRHWNKKPDEHGMVIWNFK